MNVLLLGRTAFVLGQVQQQIQAQHVTLFAGTRLEDVREAFDTAAIDVVIMGAGLDIDTRCEIAKLIFSLSDSTTVHMKDWASGPGGMIPFVNDVLSGLGSIKGGA